MPGSDDECTPDVHLKSAFVPVEPHLKFAKVESLKFSENEVDNAPSCALVVKPMQNKTADRSVCFNCEILL